MIVVYVHGNGNKVRADLLKRQWDQALFGREAGEDSRMAYWATVLHPTPLPDPEFDEIERVVPPGTEAAPAHAEPGGLQAYARDMAYTAEAVVDGEQAAAASDGAVMPEVLPLPRAVRIRIFEQLMRITFEDVHAYFFRGFAEAMRDVLRQTIADIDEPFVLVAHSLGTIIAYDVLREATGQGLKVPLLVTVGSPLGVREVQDLVTSPPLVPAGVSAWLNASDLRDVVALDHTVRGDYAPADRITDLIVTNASANHHGIREYLGADPVRRRILQTLSPAQRVQPEAVAAVDEERLEREFGHLLDNLRPVLRYDSRERYFAASVEGFVENRFEDGPMLGYASRLLRADGSLIAAADGELRAGFLGAGSYGDDRPVDEDDILDAGPEPVADARRLRERERHIDAVYGRVAPRGDGGVWLQWWMFYFQSAKGIPGVRGAQGLLGAGLHQGDWELVQVGIPAGRLTDADPVPDVAVLAAHDYAHRIAWDEVDLEPGGGWAVYVGRDSHASFPKPGRWRGKKRGPFSFDVLEDMADGGGASRRPPVQVIRLGEPAWVGWPGRWGATKPAPLIGGGSPRGPWLQRPWSDPDGFADGAHPWTEHHVPAPELVEAAPGALTTPPTVMVGRSAADWTITIAMAPGTEADWAGVLTLVAGGAQGPVVRTYDVSHPGLAPSTGEGD